MVLTRRKMIRLMYGTTTADVMQRIRAEGFAKPDPPLCIVNSTKPSVAEVIYNVSGVRAFHFTTKWHLMRAYHRWRQDPESEGLPCFLSVALLRKYLAPDIGFVMYSREAKKRLTKELLRCKKLGTDLAYPEQVLDMMLKISWRSSLEKARCVSTTNPVPWEHVVYLAVITNTEWLQKYCTTGRYASDWEKRDLEAGDVTPEEVDRQVEMYGAVKAFPFVMWAGSFFKDILISADGVKIKVEDIDGLRNSEYPPVAYHEVRKLSRLGGQVGRD
jgi:hypothetical protein